MSLHRHSTSRRDNDSAERSRTLRFLKEVAYYEDIQKGLGSRFRKATTAAFLKSAEFPLHGKPGVADTRRVLVDGFPFAIVYRVEKIGIVVHAVAHLSRKPTYWLERLGDES